MNNLTQSQFEELKEIEPYLEQSRHNYMSNMTQAKKEILFKIHRQLFGGNLGQMSCPTCCLRTARRVADPYFEYKQRLETEASTVEDMEEGPTSEKTDVKNIDTKPEQKRPKKAPKQ